MLTIINNILSSNGYEKVELELSSDVGEISLFRSSDLNSREEYFVTMRLNKQSDTSAKELYDSEAQNLFEEISHSGAIDRSFEKNCTLIICHEENKISQQTILALEEDQYNFKKNIVLYAPDEVTSIQHYLEQHQIHNVTNAAINNMINENGGSQFLYYKDNHKNQRNYYSLIIKVALKLPFITYTPKEQQLDNLDREIESSLNKEQLDIYNKLLEIGLEWNDQNVQSQVNNIWRTAHD